MTDNNLVRKPTRLEFTGPEVEPGKTLCVPCVMLWKTGALEFYVDSGELVRMPNGSIDINPKVLGNNEDQTVLTLPLEVGQDIPLNYADTKGLSAIIPMAGAIDVCWTHLAGIGAMQVSRLAVGQPGLPPGLAG